MAGYTRQDGGNISNGNIIDATDLNAEFDKLQTAFASSGGHTHDGTSDGGARIEVVGPNGEVTVGASAVTPKVSTDVDVGTASLKFNNANFKGTVSAPTFTATTGATIPSLTVGSSTAVTSVDADLSSVSTNHDTLASAKAIKTYIDSQVTAQDLDITDGTTTGSIDLDSQSLTFTGSTGITATVSNQTVTISTDDSAIAHDSLSGFVAAEHVDHSGVSITAGNGLTGGGTIESTRTLTVDPHTGIAVTTDGVALSHLGLEDLADPEADRVAFWDDSAGAFKWLEMGSNLAITGTTLNATDTDTTYSAGTGLTLSGTTFNANVNATEQTTAAETVTSTASRTYAVQVDASDNLVVNVPWVDTDTDTDTTYTAGTGLTLDGTTFNANVDATTQTVASETVSATASRTYAVQVDSSDNLVVNVPWSTSATSPASYTIDAVDDIYLSAAGGNMFFEAGTGTVDPSYVFRSTEATDNNTPVDIEIRNRDTVPADGQVLGKIRFTGEDSASSIIDYVTLEASIVDETAATQDGKFKINLYNSGFEETVFEGNSSGHTIVSAANDVYIRPRSNDVFFQAYNPSPITPDPGRQVQISLQEFYQGIYASDTLVIKSGINSNGAAYEYLKLESGDKFIFETATGTAELKNSSATQALLDWNTTDTLKIYTGSSTLNSTFSGTGLTVVGALSKGSGSFKIDHPLPTKTETHHLVHSFIEGPQADLIYRGRAELVDGTATVNIDTAAGMTDGTFVVLCGDVQCFTSNESGWTAVKGSVSGNTLTITAQDNTCTDTISWMVVGERKDQHMIDTDWTDDEGHVIVEPEKQ